MNRTETSSRPIMFLYDRYLIFAALGLAVVGLVMVASASMVISERQFGYEFYFLARQAVYLSLGVIVAGLVFQIPVAVWLKSRLLLLLLSIALLVLVLIPGIGHQVNGSQRWLMLGPVAIQVSELTKLFFIIYLAGYLSERNQELREELSGFIKPIIILVLIAVLLLLEPDFGTAAVISVTVMGMLFLAGVRLRYFFILLLSAGCTFAILAISSPYRVARLTAFLNPWANQFGSGYQLTQSLIAFGQGGWFGVGLGDSVQKLFYLPEAHTDFLFAVLAEETGLVGILTVMLLFFIVVGRAFRISYLASCKEQYFSAFVAFGIAIWLAIQSMINMGVNAGVLPTKGLTLPLISYGGSSLLVTCIAIGLLLRIDHELRVNHLFH